MPTNCGTRAEVTHVDGSFDFVNPRRMRYWTALSSFEYELRTVESFCAVGRHR
jgi:hypothetical protein